MSYGNRLSIPFTTPSLVVTVLNNQDYQNKGYVWGFDGRLHYCFLDPEKVRFDVWKKRFHWSSLLWLIMNAVALAVSPFVPALLPLAWSLPTVPFALLRHYRCTAKEQVAAIVTNGPQMVYPGNLKTRQMMFGGGATFLGILTLGAMLAPYIPQLSALLLKTFPPGKAVFVKQFMGVLRGIMQVGALRWIAAAGLAINLTAIFLFLLGFLAKPYNWVFGTKIKDLTGKMRTWFHLGRSATSFASYRIAPEQPSGLPWGCGGLIPIINNGVISSKKESLGVLNGNYDVVVWGLLPFVGDKFWSKFSWDDLSEEEQRLWEELGWDKATWDAGKEVPSSKKTWDELSEKERKALRKLGYNRRIWEGKKISEDKKDFNFESKDVKWYLYKWDELPPEIQDLWRKLGWTKKKWDGEEPPPESDSKKWKDLKPEELDALGKLNIDQDAWEENDTEGMIVVIGTKTFSNGDAIAMQNHGVTNAVATDSRLSPVIGTHGNLAIGDPGLRGMMSPAQFVSKSLLDPIQKYGFMCIPE